MPSGFYTAIDDDDLWLLDTYTYNTDTCANYVVRHYMDGKVNKSQYLHRDILQAKKGQIVDHLNGDGLDNRRSNLRFVTQSQNLANMRIRSGKKYKGITWDAQRSKWKAMISVNNKRYNIGRFNTEEEAALAYNEAAIRHHGEFARLNVLIPAAE